MKDCTKTQMWKEANKRSIKTKKLKAKLFRENYNNSPKLCVNCNSVIPFDKRFNRFCGSSCAAIMNNTKYPKRVPSKIINNKKVYIPKQELSIKCGGCDIVFLTKNQNRKYCSAGCKPRSIRKDIFYLIENGDTTQTHRQYRRYLFDKYGAKCMLCGWDKINPLTNLVPLELDHIDGNSKNNSLSNLRLICPNCSSLQPTYKGLNRGKGRFSRMKRYREGKSY